ncbi:MAG: acetate kinase [Candidatus Omnitrophica bacterium]|nr:acetate kinase [Candidatus Omnitrophota bacterium]MDD5352115.1 acetate kinase [Candidatus Omnitrophota bacterium]MDD5549713.1 acetate kinase [Candidatus Omnitrophota bacterium]
MNKKRNGDLIILTLNCGSSSVKYSLFKVKGADGDKDFALITNGQIECIGQEGSKVKNHKEAIKIILDTLGSKHYSYRNIDAVGHRVVHGGEYFRKPTLINKDVLSKIKSCAKLAPLHNPANLAGIEACQVLLPGISQVAVFDTAFHQTIPPRAYMYAIPYRYYKKYNLRKFGFHGMSHQYVSREVAKRLGKPVSQLKLITCHLGNGCSICAVKNGISVDTSMGFTPLAGLMMGTRSGDIDPAAVLYIMQKEKLSPEQMEEILNKQSGLKGVSGISNDMRIIEKAVKKGSKRAKLALSIFTYSIRKYIGAYIAIMGGVDAVVFTAGIGEHIGMKKMISYGITSFLKKLNVKFLVVHTDEELMITQEVFKTIKK